MIFNTSIPYTSIFLTFVTWIIVYSVIHASPPHYLVDKNKKFKKWKGILYSIIIATVISILLTVVSIYIDNSIKKVRTNK